jgi:FMN-dependent NADH-azoreductase
MHAWKNKKEEEDIFKRDLQKEEAPNIYVRTFRCSPSKQLHEKNQPSGRSI